MNQKQDSFELTIWQPAGTILLILGSLTMLTPLFTTLSQSALIIDSVAGGVLAAAGIAALLRGFKR